MGIAAALLFGCANTTATSVSMPSATRASSTPAEPSRAVAPPVPACISYWPEARYRALGYDHVVHIHSTCAAEAQCTVATDVNPARIHVTVPPGAEVEVVTWVGSPAREFTPTVLCSLGS